MTTQSTTTRKRKPMQKKKQIGMDMGRITEIFSQFLYSDHKVVLRELISNANDSCIRRRSVDPECTPEDLKLDVYYSSDNALVFEDTGAGMTKAEIENHLSMIGRSGTAELRRELSTTGQKELSTNLIGEFGLGFLSAFVVAEQVVVETQSYFNDHPSYRWTCSGDEFYDLEDDVGRKTVGTKIALTLKANFADLLDPTVLRRAILEFSRNVLLPIYFHPD